ncbi:MAG: peptidylprolyl isomerase [Elusimicrobiota bacterium]
MLPAVFLGCAEKKKRRTTVQQDRYEKIVRAGNTVKVQFYAFIDGELFDKSAEGEPLKFTVGQDSVIPGLDKAVLGMGINENRKVTISPEDAFGLRDENKIGELPRTAFPPDYDYRIGKIATIQDNEGNRMKGMIIKINEENISIDLNHPLAGKKIDFEIKVISIE